MERNMKKLFLTIICLTSFNPSIQASFSFDNCLPITKSTFFALHKLIMEQFYFSEECICDEEERTHAQESLNLANRKLQNKKNYWNQKTLTLWAEEAASIGDKPPKDTDLLINDEFFKVADSSQKAFTSN